MLKQPPGDNHTLGQYGLGESCSIRPSAEASGETDYEPIPLSASEIQEQIDLIEAEINALNHSILKRLGGTPEALQIEQLVVIHYINERGLNSDPAQVPYATNRFPLPEVSEKAPAWNWYRHATDECLTGRLEGGKGRYGPVGLNDQLRLLREVSELEAEAANLRSIRLSLQLGAAAEVGARQADSPSTTGTIARRAPEVLHSLGEQVRGLGANVVRRAMGAVH